MAQLAFPTSPSVGDTFSSGAWSWTWDGDKWISGGDKGFADAPSDGNLWGRRDGAWSSVAIPEIPDPSVSVVPLGGRLGIVGSSPSPFISFRPFNGGWTRINGQDYALPAAGISAGTTNIFMDGVAGQTLANSTMYFVYLFDNSGTLMLDYSTIGHTTSIQPNNAGIEIKQGDNSRTLVGIIYLYSDQLFYDELLRRCVRSWYNRGTTIAFYNGDWWVYDSIWSNSPTANIVAFVGEKFFLAFMAAAPSYAGANNFIGLSENQIVPPSLTSTHLLGAPANMSIVLEADFDRLFAFNMTVWTNGTPGGAGVLTGGGLCVTLSE